MFSCSAFNQSKDAASLSWLLPLCMDDPMSDKNMTALPFRKLTSFACVLDSSLQPVSICIASHLIISGLFRQNPSVRLMLLHTDC